MSDVPRTSRVPLVRATLRHLLAEWLDPVPVLYGFNGKEGGDRVVVHGPIVSPVDQDWALLGNRSRDEVFTLLVEFIAGRGSRTCQAANDRAYELVAPAELGLRASVQLGLASEGVITVAVKNAEHTEWADDDAWRCAVGMHVRVTARI